MVGGANDLSNPMAPGLRREGVVTRRDALGS